MPIVLGNVMKLWTEPVVPVLVTQARHFHLPVREIELAYRDRRVRRTNNGKRTYAARRAGDTRG